MIHKAIPLFLLAILFAFKVHAQPTRATTEDGRTVLLNSDGTWKLASASKSTSGKEYFDKTKRFSLTLPAAWNRQQKELGDDAELSFIREDPTLYGMVVAEDIPLKPAEVMKFFWANMDTSTTRPVREEDITINGVPMHLAVVDMTSDGLDMRMNLLIYSGDSWYAKFVTWTFKSVAEKESEDQVLEYCKGIQILKH